jgi:alkanesulfonate monooxygenase SsuD/methylene tetrahydromethanopterin reductase-like flavin-dependent oxidoreductase (luciferase family)
LNIVVRNPVVCVKALTGIDILSSGRLFAGVGPGSYKGDYDVCGIAFEDRWKRFDEALQILNLLWEQEGENEVDFNGHYYKFKKVVVAPRPFQKPHPPILIGSWGSSEPGLQRVAKYSDGWVASAYNITPVNSKPNGRRFYPIGKTWARILLDLVIPLCQCLAISITTRKKFTRW